MRHNRFQERISEQDKQHYEAIRQSVLDFMRKVTETYIRSRTQETRLLDIAPDDHHVLDKVQLPETVQRETLNLIQGSTYQADICQCNRDQIPDNTFDYVVCTEVLEHTIDPFGATKEIYRILKPEGFVFVTTPFNFMIHPPGPDCWRFTKGGLRVLFKAYHIHEIRHLETVGRWGMPIHYTTVAQKVING